MLVSMQRHLSLLLLMLCLSGCRLVAGYDRAGDPDLGSTDSSTPRPDIAPSDAPGVASDTSPELSVRDGPSPLSTRWVSSIGSSLGASAAFAVSVGGQDQAIVVGTTQGSLPNLDSNPHGGDDVFVVSYDAQGTPSWGKLHGSTKADEGLAVAVRNDLLLVGGALGGEGFVDSPFNSLYVSDGPAPFLALYSATTGAGDSAKAFEDVKPGGNDALVALAFDSKGGYCIVLTVDGQVDVEGPGPLKGPGASDVVLACYDNGNQHTWSAVFGGPGIDNAAALTISGSRVFLLAKTVGQSTYGGPPLSPKGSAVDIVVAAFQLGRQATPEKQHLWSKRWGGTSGDLGRALKVSSDGKTLAVVGQTTSATADFDGETLTPKGDFDGFVALLSLASSTVQKVLQFGSTSAVDVRGVTAIGNDELIVVGAFDTKVDFAGQSQASGGAGVDNLFLVGLDTKGFVKGLRVAGGSGTSAVFPHAVTAAGKGDVVVVGRFEGTINFGVSTLTAKGSQDAFIWRVKAP